MATLKEKIVAKIKPCCRNMACAEQAADVAIKLVEEKFTPTNTSIDAIALLGKWHRAYHDSRDALEKVDDETVKYMASVAQQHNR